MLGGRAIGAIIGIISACSLFFLFVACCIVYYRRYLTRKAHTYVTAAQADDERNTEQRGIEQPRTVNRTTNYIASDSPPPYHEAIKHEAKRHLSDV